MRGDAEETGAFSGPPKYLTQRAKRKSSVQSIIGATDRRRSIELLPPPGSNTSRHGACRRPHSMPAGRVLMRTALRSRKSPIASPRARPENHDPHSGALLAAMTHNDPRGDIRRQVEYQYADFVKRHAGVMNRVKLRA
jgi:hypothetical protein